MMSQWMSADEAGATVPEPDMSEMFSIELTRKKKRAEVSCGSVVARIVFPCSSRKVTSTETLSIGIRSSPLLILMCASNACLSRVSSCWISIFTLAQTVSSAEEDDRSIQRKQAATMTRKRVQLEHSSLTNLRCFRIASSPRIASKSFFRNRSLSR